MFLKYRKTDSKNILAIDPNENQIFKEFIQEVRTIDSSAFSLNKFKVLSLKFPATFLHV